jgi:penicillin-binding protein 2
MFNSNFLVLKIRVIIVAAFFVSLTANLILKLHKLTVGTERTQTHREVRFVEKTLMTPPARGIISDRWGVRIADVEPRLDLDISLPDLKTIYRQKFRTIPMLLDPNSENPIGKVDVEKVVTTLMSQYFEIMGESFQLDRAALEKHDLIRENIPFTVKRGLTFQDVAEISEKTPVISGVNIVPRAVRFYPYGASASHILGYVGEPERRADHLLRRGPYKMEAEIIGRSGLERMLDSQLQGLPGYRTVEVDYLGNIRRIIDDSNKATIGNTVYLTIDMRIQQIVERVMAGVGRGACVVMDVHNGDILAMASVPNFDPNLMSNTDILNSLAQNPAAPLFNRAVAAYAPGSVFKPVVALTALHHNVIDKNFTVNNIGYIMIANRQRKCWSFEKGGLGFVDFYKSIASSCNVYYYTIATLRSDFDLLLRDMTDQMGFSRKTGIPITGEESGVIPDRRWMKENYPRDRWSVGHMANTCIGQGYTKVTPLQMANFTCTIANNGFVYRPRLVMKVEDPWGNLVWPDDYNDVFQGELLTHLPVAEWKIQMVKEGMRRAVNVPGGTAGRARLPDIQIAGKTGTAQFTTKINGQMVKVLRAWFISFAPFENPVYSITLVVEGGQSGGQTAAPLVREIYRQIFDMEQGITQPLAYLHPYKGSLEGVHPVTEHPDSEQTTTRSSVTSQTMEETDFVSEMPENIEQSEITNTPELAPVRRAIPVRRNRL